MRSALCFCRTVRSRSAFRCRCAASCRDPVCPVVSGRLPLPPARILLVLRSGKSRLSETSVAFSRIGTGDSFYKPHRHRKRCLRYEKNAAERRHPACESVVVCFPDLSSPERIQHNPRHALWPVSFSCLLGCVCVCLEPLLLSIGYDWLKKGEQGCLASWFSCSCCIDFVLHSWLLSVFIGER